MEKKSAHPFKIKRLSIPLERVFERPGFNCRFSATDVDDLAKSMGHPDVGLLFPPLVVVAEDRPPLSPTRRFFYIVHGHRRVAAARQLGWTRCSFVVAECLKLTDQYILNLAENARENLTPAEIAERCCMIVDTVPAKRRTLTTDELAERMGYSLSHLRNLMRLRRSLHEDLWTVMVRLGHRAPVGALITIVAKPPEEQLAIWTRIHAAVMEQPETNEGKGPRAQRYTWRTRAAEILEGAQTTGEGPDFLRGVRWAIGRLRGEEG